MKRVFDICLNQSGSRLIEAENEQEAVKYFTEHVTAGELLSMLDISADDSATDEVWEEGYSK